METIAIILGLIVGTGVFFLLNQLMDITYFGCGAIFSFWLGCVVFTALFFVLIGAVILGVIDFVGSKMNGSEE